MFCFPCCVDEQTPPRRRPRIDRSQIGLPTNFVHTKHMGMGEALTTPGNDDMQHMKSTMGGKGEYDHNTIGITTTMNRCIDITQINGTPLSGNMMSKNKANERDDDRSA